MKRSQRRTRPTRREALAMLRDLYDQIPDVACRGLCHDSCTAIDASELERELLRERGIELSDVPAVIRMRAYKAGDAPVPRCPALTSFNTCKVYDVRPFICRAFGSAEPLCEHGCMPAAVIESGEVMRTVRDIERLSRAVTGVRRLPLPEDAR